MVFILTWSAATESGGGKQALAKHFNFFYLLFKYKIVWYFYFKWISFLNNISYYINFDLSCQMLSTPSILVVFKYKIV
jgi:hypothetical protein